MSAQPNSALNIRPMTEADVEAVMEIERRAYPFPWTAGIFLDCIRVGYSCWACTLDEQLCGYAVLSYGAGEAHLLNICIAPERQGRGLGRTLLQHVISQAARLGAQELFLEVRPSNLNAQALYRDTGFVQIGVRRDYYPDYDGLREDALVMSLRLTDT